MFYNGTAPSQAREMTLDDIFALRLDLLLITAQDFLAGSKMSSLQRRVTLQNGRYIQTESMALGHLYPQTRDVGNPHASIFIDQYFYGCAHQLAGLMVYAARAGSLRSSQRRSLREMVAAMELIQRVRRTEPSDGLTASIEALSVDDDLAHVCTC